MATRAVAFVSLGLGLMLGGCMQSVVEQAAPDIAMKPRDRELLANAPYAQVSIPEQYRRHIVSYHRKESAGTIVVDSDSRFLYYVLPQGQAIRYGITVGEDALRWSGVAKIGNMTEWPGWTPTPSEHARLGPLPAHVSGGPHNPMGARALYLYESGKDTLYRIHGTNQPEYIGHAISSGCIRMTNEDVIDLFNRAKIGTPVVVLARGQGDGSYRPQASYQGGNASW